ncbi:OmpA family protein [Flaviaesturariibacter amylovorans]|uniref:OmpA-like domain-containing protein n=1 Tax=Flaviaesturariibacter amylovorans TaxID=1084520 RepID=A0ABP8H2E8_9BACT
MKKLLVTVLALSCVASAFAQKGAYIRPAAIGISFFRNDYLTPNRIRTSSLASVLNNRQIAGFQDVAIGVGLHYWKGLTNNLDFAGGLRGSSPDVILNNGTKRTNGEKFQVEGDASVNYKFFSDRYFFTPYVSAGVGASYLDGTFDAILPLGIGFKFNFSDEGALFLDGSYRVPVTTNRANGYHVMYGFGYAARVGRKQEAPKKEVPPIPAVEKDTDSDGILDSADKCPTVPGVAQYQGCPVPDTDKDGIADDQDKCPTVAGTAKYQGCPIPDTDLDGINDEEDKCPNERGVAKYGGCPVPDTDKDGVNDEQDKCPTVAGPAENNGCPVVKEEIVKRIERDASRIYFATGSARLLASSNAALNDIVKLLNEDKDIKVAIEGHTDNVGKDDYNQKLSEDRAASVKNYLLGKGIDASRLQSQGFGESQPIADNKTAAGRSKNRRVVMRPTYE